MVTPGELKRWIGRELFSEPHMGLSAYMCQAKPEGLALVIALGSYVTEDDAGQDITVDMALIIVDRRLGWAPTEWLQPLGVA